MTSTDQIKEWGADHIVDAMRLDDWFALDMFYAVAGATKVAERAAAFGKTAEQNGCTVELGEIAVRLRRLADVFDSSGEPTP
jgi:hypothetical protein